jgi:hypothetical protein
VGGEAKKEPYSGWTLLELFGHRRLAGYIEEVEIAGRGFLRLDVYAGDAEDPAVSQFYGAEAVYCMTPTTAETARAFAANTVPRPVARFELEPSAAREEPVDAEIPYEDEVPF